MLGRKPVIALRCTVVFSWRSAPNLSKYINSLQWSPAWLGWWEWRTSPASQRDSADGLLFMRPTQHFTNLGQSAVIVAKCHLPDFRWPVHSPPSRQFTEKIVNNSIHRVLPDSQEAERVSRPGQREDDIRLPPPYTPQWVKRKRNIR